MVDIIIGMFGAVGFDLLTAPTNMAELIPWFLKITVAMSILWFFLSWVRSLTIAVCGVKSF